VFGHASYYELVSFIGFLAHHAGCLERIHWDQAHSARDAVIQYDIGQIISYCHIGQGDGRLSIGRIGT
jgi:hypothetical protein